MVEVDPAHVVGTGGAVGAALRYYVSKWVEIEEFPAETLTVNVLGSFVLGLVVFWGVDERLFLLLGTGVCGSFTTFSSFSFETVRLWESGERGRAVLNAIVNFVGSAAAIGLAWVIVSVL